MKKISNIEPVDRDYENVQSGKEKKILFYSKTLEKVRTKYWKWRFEYLQNKKRQYANNIGVQERIITDDFIGKKNQEKRKRKIEKLQDKIEIINLELETTHYPSIKVRLLKVADRAKKNICSWWVDFIQDIPFVGKLYQKGSTMQANDTDISEGPIRVDDIGDPKFVKQTVDQQLEYVSSSDSHTYGTDSLDSSSQDSTYSFDYAQLKDLHNNGVINATDIMSPSAIRESQEKLSDMSQDGGFQQSMEDRYVPEIPIDRFDNRGQSSEISANSLLSEDMNFTISSQQIENDHVGFNDSVIDDPMAAYRKYQEQLSSQQERYARMEEITRQTMERKKEAEKRYQDAADSNVFMREAIAATLNQMEQQLGQEEARTSAQNAKIESQVEQFQESTSRLEDSNRALEEMCRDLYISVPSQDGIKGEKRISKS